MSRRSSAANSYEDLSFPEIPTDLWSQLCTDTPLAAATPPPTAAVFPTLSPVKAISDPHLHVEESDSSLWDEFPDIQTEDLDDIESEIERDALPSTYSEVIFPPLYLILDNLFDGLVEAEDIEDAGTMATGKWNGIGGLISKYKRSGALSVTNLVQPLWCEYKMYYGLVGLEKRGVEKRPKEFKVTRKVLVENKVVKKKVVIKVDQIVIHTGEKNRVRGQKIHKKLEKEVAPLQVKVRTKTQEEIWGLKLLNMITGLVVLKKTRLWRELPVFGLIRRIPVNGVIDELKLEPSPAPEKANVLRISDVKTKSATSRIDRSTPKEHRVQLMVYKQLLDGLLSPSFDWEHLFETYKLNVFKTFSDAFIAQMITLVKSNELGEGAEEVRNLNGLRILWKEAVLGLDLVCGEVSPQLSIVYRQAVPGKQDASSEEEGDSSEDSVVLARQQFNYDEEFVGQAVEQALEFWLGTRKQLGVSLNETWKCGTCEYKADCEWRAEQASVFSQKRKSKR